MFGSYAANSVCNVSNMQVAMKPMTDRMSVAYRSTCQPTIGQPLAVDISTNITFNCQSTYQPMLDRYVGRYVDQHIWVIGRHSTNMLHIGWVWTDMSVNIRLICQPIHRSNVGRYVDWYIGWGEHKIHMIRLDYQLLFGRGAEIEPTLSETRLQLLQVVVPSQGLILWRIPEQSYVFKSLLNVVLQYGGRLEHL